MDYKYFMKKVKTTSEFSKWYASLRDRQAKAKIQVRIDRMEMGLFGDCEPVGEGISEARIHYGPGYRIFFVERGAEIIVILAGGIKKGQQRGHQEGHRT